MIRGLPTARPVAPTRKPQGAGVVIGAGKHRTVRRIEQGIDPDGGATPERRGRRGHSDLDSPRRCPRHDAVELHVIQPDSESVLAKGCQADDAAGQHHLAGRRRQHRGIERQGPALGGDKTGGAGGNEEPDRGERAAADLDRHGHAKARGQQCHEPVRLDRQGEVEGSAGGKRHRYP